MCATNKALNILPKHFVIAMIKVLIYGDRELAVLIDVDVMYSATTRGTWMNSRNATPVDLRRSPIGILCLGVAFPTSFTFVLFMRTFVSSLRDGSLYDRINFVGKIGPWPRTARHCVSMLGKSAFCHYFIIRYERGRST